MNAFLEIAPGDVRDVMSRRQARVTGPAQRDDGRVRGWSGTQDPIPAAHAQVLMGAYLPVKLVGGACAE